MYIGLKFTIEFSLMTVIYILAFLNVMPTGTFKNSFITKYSLDIPIKFFTLQYDMIYDTGFEWYQYCVAT